jgi:peptidoglycan/xylan/chitin deacetylase (PgdA/CDA1 family)
MKYLFISILLIFNPEAVISQNAGEFTNSVFLGQLVKDSSFLQLKRKIVSKYSHYQPGKWGQFIPGVIEEISNKNKYIAFTFDGCGGKNGNGFDKDLIDFLRTEKIPATLFLSGKWIDANFSVFQNLSKDTLFEIENHGLNHKPCSVNGRSEYGIQGTLNVGEVFDEIYGNALKIKAITNIYPKYFRPGTAFIDEASLKIASDLGIRAVSFKVLSGDAVPDASAMTIEGDVLKSIKPGAIVIMHLNHPEWNTFEAMELIVPKLRQKGYIFVRLKDADPIQNNRSSK